MRWSRGGPALAALLLLLVLSTRAGAGPLDALEDDFEKAIGRITPATVFCVPRGVPDEQVPGGSSGVLVSRKGLVLSDGDVGHHVAKGPDGKPANAWSDEIEVRIPNLGGKGFRAYPARVLKRDRDVDSSLLRIEEGPSSAWKDAMQPGRSDDLRVGDFVFAMGNAFQMGVEAPPTLTAGVLSSLTAFEGTTAEGRFQAFYVSAAINPGMNGGPVADAEGRLIGTVSTFVLANDPHQFLGKVVPIDRLRALYAGLPESEELFPEREARGVRTRNAAQLELVFHVTARRAAARALVSLEITRTGGGQLQRVGPGGNGLVPIPGASRIVSGILVDDQGHVATCLYNLTNIGALLFNGWEGAAPAEASVQAGLAGIEAITAHLPDGSSMPARLVGTSESDNLAVLQLEWPVPAGMGPLPVVPEDQLDVGRFTLALGCPFGVARRPDPLLTFGVLSKRHGADAPDPWAGQLQTDAGLTDGNAGGLAVDLEGRWIGMLCLWSPVQHGRNSGIGFILPARRLLEVLAPILEGRSRPWLGLTWHHDQARSGLVVDSVLPDGPAQAGLAGGDLVLRIEGEAANSLEVATRLLRRRWSGDTLRLSIQRGTGGDADLEVTLGRRPD